MGRHRYPHRGDSDASQSIPTVHTPIVAIHTIAIRGRQLRPPFTASETLYIKDCYPILAPTTDTGAAMVTDKATTPNTEQDKRIRSKWGKHLTDAGWTALPNIIFERQHALGLDSLDINILLHLAGYWWHPKDMPRPSKETLAKAIGVHARTIQRRIAELEKGGYVKRIKRKASAGDNLPNEYDLSGLIRAAEPFALEKLNDIENRQQENAKRLARKRPIRVIKGGKE
jgi:hypothetical protein